MDSSAFHPSPSSSSSPSSSLMKPDSSSVMVRRHHMMSSNNTNTNAPTTTTSMLGDLDDLMHSKLIMSATPEDLKQESLSDILAQGEVQELRDWFHRTMAQLEELQQERDYYQSKCQALTQVLQATTQSNAGSNRSSSSAETTQLMIQTSSLKVAELSLEVEGLKHQLQQNQSKLTLLEQEREANRGMLVELSTIVRAFSDHGAGGGASTPISSPSLSSSSSSSLMTESSPSKGKPNKNKKNKSSAPSSPSSVTMMMMDSNNNSNSNNNSHDNDNTVVITPAMACEMTIRGLKAQVEALEDERGELVSEMVSLQTACDEMRKENDARAIKIAALEKQFHSINQARELVVSQLVMKKYNQKHLNQQQQQQQYHHNANDIMTDDTDDCSVMSTSTVSSRRSLRWPRLSNNNHNHNNVSSSASVASRTAVNKKSRG